MNRSVSVANQCALNSNGRAQSQVLSDPHLSHRPSLSICACRRMRSKCGLLVQLARNRLRSSDEPGVPNCRSHKLLEVYAV
jgi:hypothetical protein